MSEADDPARVLILFAHPALQKSRVNRVLAEAVGDLSGVTFHDLYQAYPAFDIDVDHEQGLMEAHQVIIWQHPFFWYSTPAILKEWQDLVLEHGWAYGSQGKALHGKLLLSVITTGGSEEAYQAEGYNGHTMAQLLAPIAQTARLCGMRNLPPFVVHGTHLMTSEQLARHGAEYRRVVEALRDGRLDLEAAGGLPRLNADLDAILVGPGNRSGEGPDAG